jgi:hypothetical protein
MVQAAGTMLRLGANAFRQTLNEVPGLERLLLRYAWYSRSRSARPRSAMGTARWTSGWPTGC